MTPRPVLVSIEATGSMYWFLELMTALATEVFRGNPPVDHVAGRN
jgi:hypothetical protein